jgi:hypothetical protein
MRNPKGNVTMEIGALPEPHELETIYYLANLGKDILVLAPRRQQGMRTADIRMDGHDWEIKSPTKNGKYTITHAFRDALEQSCYVIFDTRRMPESWEQRTVGKIMREFKHVRKVKHLKIITREEVLDIIK